LRPILNNQDKIFIYAICTLHPEEEGIKAQENNSSATETTTVSLPKALLARVDAILEVKGYVSRAEYVRAAIQKQLASDEGRA
jgi:hypothetical protein